MRKRVWLAVALGSVLVLGTVALVLSRMGTTSTHHAQIRILVPEYETDPGRMLKDYEQAVQAIEAWAGPAGFYRLPENTDRPRQRWIGSGANRNERIVWFQEKSPRDKSFPREVMIACDPDGPFAIEIALAEGYRRHPSRQLHALYEALRDRMEQLYPGKLHGSVW
jgi:hypothetical protein